MPLVMIVMSMAVPMIMSVMIISVVVTMAMRMPVIFSVMMSVPVALKPNRLRVAPHAPLLDELERVLGRGRVRLIGREPPPA